MKISKSLCFRKGELLHFFCLLSFIDILLFKSKFQTESRFYNLFIIGVKNILNKSMVRIYFSFLTKTHKR